MVNSIELMMDEHQVILRMLDVIRTACIEVMNGAEIDYNDFEDMMDFVKNYADDHHHGKEEKYLFKEMTDRLVKIGQNLITNGMLVEHDFGRFYMQELRAALQRVKEGDQDSKVDVIANAVSYTHLLRRHIGKEDQVVYTYAAKNLPAEVMEEVNRKSTELEEAANIKGTQQRYLDMVERLEQKYKK